MNASQARDPRFWQRWYASGAIQQPKLPEGGLPVVAIIINPGCNTTLGIGEKIVEESREKVVREIMYAVEVPPDEKYVLGMILTKIPGNARPSNYKSRATSFLRI